MVQDGEREATRIEKALNGRNRLVPEGDRLHDALNDLRELKAIIRALVVERDAAERDRETAIANGAYNVDRLHERINALKAELAALRERPKDFANNSSCCLDGGET